MDDQDSSKSAGAAGSSGSPFEAIPEAEAAEIDETAALTVKLQDVRAQHDTTPDGRPLRGVHAKSHG